MKIIKALGIIALVIVGLLTVVIVVASIVYTPEYVYRVLVWQESDAFDWQKFPNHPLQASSTPYHFNEAPDPRVAQLFSQLAGVDSWDRFLEDNHTQAFIVIQDGKVRYENYFNNTQRDSIVTSFSVAKSFVSTLVGLALEDGYIHSLDDPITQYLPELAERDPRFNDITIRHVLMMATGLEYVEFRPLLFNGDDPLSTYYPDQRKITLENTHIIDPPGQYFHYNKYGPQLLGLILERSTGMPVTQYLQTRLWEPLGMEFDGSWSTDSRSSDFEKMETGVNARAIDFAKLGALFLNGGDWQGKPVIPKEWVDEATQPYFPDDKPGYYPDWFASLPGNGYYKYMWWGLGREGGAYDFTAEGDKGQYIYVSPANKMVIVRNGIDYGSPTQEWMRLFYEFADQY